MSRFLKKLFIDAGHNGQSDPGALGGGFREADFVLDITLRAEARMSKLPGLQVKMSRTEHRNLSNPYTSADDLMARINAANTWGADLYVSIHVNAAGSLDAHGYETWVALNASAESVRVAHIAHKHLAKHFRADRGVKKNDFWVLARTTMPAYLVELGFITNANDRALLTQASFRQKLADSICDGLIEAYPHLKGAEQIPEGLTPLLGSQTITVGRALAYFEKTAPGNGDIVEHAYDLAPVYSMRPEPALALMLHETGKFAFGGLVLPEDNNFGGIGATGAANPSFDLNTQAGRDAYNKLLNGVNPARARLIGGRHGWTFATRRDGVEAVLQHIYAYATSAPLPREVVDPRYALVAKGVAPYLEQLGGRWAVPGYDRNKFSSFDEAFAAGETYGHTIRNRYLRPMLATTESLTPSGDSARVAELEAQLAVLRARMSQIKELAS